jgi:hypothetical protein
MMVFFEPSFCQNRWAILKISLKEYQPLLSHYKKQTGKRAALITAYNEECMFFYTETQGTHSPNIKGDNLPPFFRG